MATAVLNLDFENLPPKINDLEGYVQAFILIHVRKRPVGQVLVPVKNGLIDRIELLEILKEKCGWSLCEQILHDYLGWETVEVPHPLPQATVAVITRDRPKDLTRCLNALLKIPDEGQEYLVVDNCPATDETKRVVDNYGGRVRYVREDRPGASAARNRALREARYEIVAFCDDDAAPDPAWLRSLLRNFSDPLVLCVTGLTMPLELKTKAQRWFEIYTPLGRGFSRKVFDFDGHDSLDVAPVGVSANMALRRSIIDHVGLFDEALGPGTPTRAGEDYELFSRILTSGYRIVYDPAALSWHRHRHTWQELRQAVFGYGVAVYAFWTRALIVEKELRVLRLAWFWLTRKQLPNLIRSLLRRKNRAPLDLLLVELCGCTLGPWAYIFSRQRINQRNNKA